MLRAETKKSLYEDPGKWKEYLQAAERIGIVEETKLEPTFEEGIKKVETYRLAVDGTLDGLEAIMQPNHKVVETGAIVAPPGQNPHELMAAACTKLKHFVESNQQDLTTIIFQARLEIVIGAMNKLAGGRAVITNKRPGGGSTTSTFCHR
ncbi:hypothetical protein COOONC_18327 [Cooperia oncophora]